jgi:phytoene desaturase
VVYEKMLLLVEEQEKDGFTFDMGQVGTGCHVFDRFFADFGKKTTDYYELVKSPAYRVYFGVDEFITIADNLAESKLLLNPLKKEAALSCTNLLLRQKTMTLL